MDSTPSRRWREMDRLLAEALDLPPDQRAAFLARACDGEADLLREMHALLESADEGERLLGESATLFAAPLLDSLPGAADDGDPANVAEGERIGPYRIVKEIGRGGMGSVFLAERADDQFEQRVALKLIRRGMDTDEVLDRFRQERQILASLEHPNIARLLDGGVATDGRPYLVMEHVEGVPLDRYCDDHELTVEQRLALVRSVCGAVQFAHQRLVVHRDIKPSNILVASDGTPKLLDFGIAKVLGEEASGQVTPHTRTGYRILTPEFASPEQLRGENVTTASDVYALGVLLYLLLTGRRPFEDRRDRDPDRVPDRPSAAVLHATGGGGVDAAAIADVRRTSVDGLRRQLRGDLDTVVMRALEPEPTRRYQSAQQLLDDLERHTSGRPVRARPATLLYRTTKFVRRHRVGVLAAGLVAASLVGGLGVAAAQARRAARERDVARSERDRAEAVASFLESLFAASNPDARGAERLDTLRVRAFLDRGAATVQRELASRPQDQARMLRVMGRAYRNLGAYDQATPLFTTALAHFRGAADARTLDVAETLADLGTLAADRGDAAGADTLFRASLAIRRELLGTEHADVARAIAALAGAQLEQARFDDAKALYDESLAMHRRLGVPDSSALVAALNGRMTLASRTEDLETALPLAREILGIQRTRLGDAHPRVAGDMNNLAFLLRRTGSIDDAEAMYREALSAAERAYGADHPNVSAVVDNLASVVAQRGRVDESDSLYRRVIDMRRRIFGGSHPAISVSLSNFADQLSKRGDHAEAARLYGEALDIARATSGPRHPSVGIVSGRLARSLCTAGDVARGERLQRDALTILQAAFGEGHPRVAEGRNGLARCLIAGRRYAEAEPVLLAAHAALQAPNAPPELLRSVLGDLVRLYSAWGKPEGAAPFQQQLQAQQAGAPKR